MKGTLHKSMNYGWMVQDAVDSFYLLHPYDIFTNSIERIEGKEVDFILQDFWNIGGLGEKLIKVAIISAKIDMLASLQQDTYGSKGSDVMTPENHIGVLSEAIRKETTSSQTEISDEDIEKGAWENQCLSRQDVYELFDEVFKDKTLEGMFKISASKEVRQFKERLRQLAKEKYREQLKQRQ